MLLDDSCDETRARERFGERTTTRAISMNGILNCLVGDRPRRPLHDASSRSAPGAGRRKRDTDSAMRSCPSRRGHSASTASVWRSRGGRSAANNWLVPGTPGNWSCPSRRPSIRSIGAAGVRRSRRAMRSGSDARRHHGNSFAAMREISETTRALANKPTNSLAFWLGMEHA